MKSIFQGKATNLGVAGEILSFLWARKPRFIPFDKH